MKVVQDSSVRWISDNWVTQATPDGDGTVFSVLRIPFDHAVSHRPGARFGPDAIVAQLNEFSLYCTDKRVSLKDVRFMDLGEVEVFHSLPDTYRNVGAAVDAIPSGTRPVFLGGDHSITDPIIRGLLSRANGQKLGLVVFDAHFDSRDPVYNKEHSGHWMKTLEDVLDYRVVAQLGISSNLYSEEYMERAESSGIMVRTVYDIRRDGWRATIENVVRHVTRGTAGAYISIDIDCLDQAVASGTSVPNPSGFLAHEVIDAVFELSAATDIVGLDVTEVSPPLDGDDATARVAAYIVLNHVAGVVARTRSGALQLAGEGAVQKGR
jgi:agmatinase